MALLLIRFSRMKEVLLFGTLFLALSLIAQCIAEDDTATLFNKCMGSVQGLTRDVEDIKLKLGSKQDASSPWEQNCRCPSVLNQTELLLKLNQINREELKDIKIESENEKHRIQFESTLDRIETVINKTVALMNVHLKETRCKGGWHYFQDSCYFFSSAEGTWNQGRDACQEMGAFYVKITTTEEWQFIEGHVTANAYIGLNDIETEGTYKWSSDGTVDDNIHPTWWHQSQPTGGRGENCIHYWVLGPKIMWNDMNCNIIMRYICEMNPTDL